MANVIFGAGSVHNAVEPVTIGPAGLSCQMQVILATGSDANGNPTGIITQSNLISFTATGAAQTVTVPVTMPAGGKSLYAFVDVISGGTIILGLVDPAQVIVPSASGGIIVWT